MILSHLLDKLCNKRGREEIDIRMVWKPCFMKMRADWVTFMDIKDAHNFCISSFVSVTTEQLPQDKTVRERWLPRPHVWAHGGLLLHPRSLPAPRAVLPARAGGLLGPVRDARLPGPPVPAEAGGLQALPGLGRRGCRSGLSETGHRWILGCVFLVMLHIEMQ